MERTVSGNIDPPPIFPPEIDRWIRSFKVRSFPWIDRKRIYFNVQYFAPGQSICKPPVWDRTVFIINNEAGRTAVSHFAESVADYISTMPEELFIEGKEVQLEYE